MHEDQPRRSLTDLAGILDGPAAEEFERAIDESDAEYEAKLEPPLDRLK